MPKPLEPWAPKLGLPGPIQILSWRGALLPRVIGCVLTCLVVAALVNDVWGI